MNKRLSLLLLLLVCLLLSLVRSSPHAVPPLDPSNYIFPAGGGYLVPQGYYHSSPIMPFDMPLERWLGLATWNKEYRANGFDCSQMSAFLEWVLNNAGYSARFFVGYGHCWLSIKVEDEWMLYESTQLAWISEIDEHIAQYCQPQKVFSNLYDTEAWFQRAVWAGAYTEDGAETIFLSEFGWWIQEEE